MMQVTTTLDLMEDKSFLDKDLPKFSFDLLHSKSKVLLLGSLDSKKYRFLENMYKWVQTKKIGDCLMFPKCLFFEDITYPFDERSCALVFEKSQKENQNLALFLDLCDPWMQSSKVLRTIMLDKDSCFLAASCISLPGKYYFTGTSFDWIVLFEGLSPSKLNEVWKNYIAWTPTLEEFVYLQKLHTNDNNKSCILLNVRRLQEISQKDVSFDEILSCFQKYTIKYSTFG